MRKYLILLLLACSCMAFSQTSEKKKISIYGHIADYITHVYLENVKATLMLPDSTIIDSCMNNNGYYDQRKLYNFNVPIGKYIVKLEKEGYETAYSNVSVDKIRKRETIKHFPTVYLKKPKVHAIDEVVVTATKVKFYHKKDTLVYNADAFVTAEGATLNELIKQLPGVELKSNGQIFVNGRFVESLILNGKDFFGNDNTIMLENLPTYAVNTVKVYEKKGKISEFLGKELADDKSFVMDVNLKKQYNTGWMGNVDAGGANHDLYMARLFAMRSTDHSRITMYGNFNNLNDFTTPQSGSDWTPDKMPYGRLTTKDAGININIDDREKRFEYSGNASFTHYDNHETQDTYRQNFLSTGDTYDRSARDAQLCNFFLNTFHNLILKPGGRDSNYNINMSLRGNYSDMNHEVMNLSATSQESWNAFNDFAKILSEPILSPELRGRLINRHLENSISERKSWKTFFDATSYIRLGYAKDLLYFRLKGNVNGSEDRYFSRNRVDYFAKDPVTTDFRNEYTERTPSRGYNYEANVYYGQHGYSWGGWNVQYIYNNSYNNSTNRLYSLEKLDGWGIDTDHPLGTLPSEQEYLATLRGNSSYNSIKHDNHHFFIAKTDITLKDNDKVYFRVTPSVTLNLQQERMKYRRETVVDTAFVRNMTLVSPGINAEWRTTDWKQQMYFNYKMDTYSPNMLYSVNFVDDTDPMNIITYGNKNLKNRRQHHFDISYTDKRKSVTFAPYANFNIYDNNISAAYVYDKTTGNRKYSYLNVDGNWDMALGLNTNGPIDKKHKMYFTSNTSWNYYNSVDMIGTETTAVPVKSTVRSSVLSENLTLSYSLGKHSVGAKGSLAWTRSSGDRDDFTTINAYNFNYGVWGTMNLPWKFQIDTDVTVYSRRGYEDSSMNDNNFVWNARLSRPFFKGKLVLKADAFDILHQLKKVDRSINVQGRTERYYNTLPRYILMHAVYKFDIKPKNKK